MEMDMTISKPKSQKTPPLRIEPNWEYARQIKAEAALGNWLRVEEIKKIVDHYGQEWVTRDGAGREIPNLRHAIAQKRLPEFKESLYKWQIEHLSELGNPRYLLLRGQNGETAFAEEMASQKTSADTKKTRGTELIEYAIKKSDVGRLDVKLQAEWARTVKSSFKKRLHAREICKEENVEAGKRRRTILWVLSGPIEREILEDGSILLSKSQPYTKHLNGDKRLRDQERIAKKARIKRKHRQLKKIGVNKSFETIGGQEHRSPQAIASIVYKKG